jgi:hypothetical protein
VRLTASKIIIARFTVCLNTVCLMLSVEVCATCFGSCLSVCLSVLHMEQLDYNWTNLDEIRHLGIFRKSVEKIEF